MNPTTAASSTRRLPIGAEPDSSGEGVSVRVWASNAPSVEVVIEDVEARVLSASALTAEGGGYFSGLVPGMADGSLYRFRLGASPDRYPDPASRYQPLGPHGPSQVVSPSQFVWTDGAWPGARLDGQILYELHVGTFTPAGTWQAAAEQLPRLARLGITAIEVMPLADFPGRFGWGYDGVNLYAPSRLYGTPDDARRFVDRAHALGIAVILDVVYNHVGPDGNYLRQFSDAYFSSRYESEWGDSLNFDDEDAGPVREFVRENAAYWISEFHLDGLRLDATQQVFDASPRHILREIADAARAAAGRRSVLIVAENEPQDTRLIRAVEDDGFGLDALWNDDFHHAAVVALTGRREAYYTDYDGSPQEMLSLAKWGFLFQGQRYSWQRNRRGTSAFGLAPARFITFLENHDQVANAPSGGGERLHQLSSPGTYRAMTAFWLLTPGTPMFFQGQEFGASTPFRYFADHQAPLSHGVHQGRAKFMEQFRSAAATDLSSRLPNPSDEQTFHGSSLRLDEAETHIRSLALHQDLLALRRDEPLLGTTDGVFFDGAVLGSHAFVVRFFARDPRCHPAGATDRLLIVNFGHDLRFDPAPEPLLAPSPGMEWAIRWSSEDPRYGGLGTAPLDTEHNWLVPGQAAVLLALRIS